MNLVVLGSGASSFHSRRASSGYWLETAAGAVMLDMSAAAVHRAAQENLDWANLDAIWISHFHLDHVGGVAPFLFGTKYAFETQNRTKPLRIFGAKGLRKLLETFNSAGDYKIFAQPFPLEIVEIEAGASFEILPNVKAETFSTPHTAESMAIKIVSGATSLVYTADTGFDEKIGEFAGGVDLFLLEGSFVERSPVESHLAAPQCVELIKIARPKRAMLTHFYAEWDAVDFQPHVAKYASPCEVLEAQDGLRLTI
jgi:ribonuclease BN (tRNA processing enzyme)